MKLLIKISIVAIGAILLSGCSNNQEGNGKGSVIAMGRYVEEPAEEIVDEDLFSGNYISTSPDGDKMISQYIDYNNYDNYIMNGENKKIQLSELSAESNVFSFYGNDNFFYGIQSGKVYQVNPKSGDALFLFEIPSYASYGATNGKILYVADIEGIQIYDLEKKELLQQDETLNQLLLPLIQPGMGGQPFLLNPDMEREGLYIVTKDGLFHHVLYETQMQQIMIGSLYSMGDRTKSFINMTITEEDDHNIYNILYTDGSMMKYVFDETLPAVPETELRIYGIYEDINVRQAVSAFQNLHPELYVKYEVGISGEDGVTLSDALKNLSTELVAGRGPDILLMDNIPYESYVEKGILAELSLILEQSENTYFQKIINGLKIRENLYTIPVSFSIPILGGSNSKLTEITSLSQMADLLEEEREHKTSGNIFSFISPKRILRLLSQSSQGAWMTTEGELDKEALRDFLTQSKRIYEAQIAGLSKEQIEGEYYNPSFSSEAGTRTSILFNHFETYGIKTATANAMYQDQSYFADYLSDNAFEFMLFLCLLDEIEGDYAMMPGQKQGTCLVSTLISINSATQRTEEASQFVSYMLSYEFQKSENFVGVPINQEAYYAKQKHPHPERPADQKVTGIGMSDDNGFKSLDAFWPDENEFRKLNNLVEGIIGVNLCNDTIFEAVMELGPKALTGEVSVEDVVAEIDKKVQIYLAE